MVLQYCGCEDFAKYVAGPFREGFWPCRDPWDIVRLRTSSSYWNVPGEYGPYSELFFFLIKNEPVVPTKVVPLKPAVPAEMLKAGALIGLRGPVQLVVSFRGSWEGFQGSVVQGTLCGKTMCLARQVRLPLGCEVIGQDWSSEVAALFLEDWEHGRVALSCHRAMDLLCTNVVCEPR